MSSNRSTSLITLTIIALLIMTACGAPDEPELGPAPVFCQPGQGLMENGEGCELCPPGTFNDEGGAVECQVCPPGTYQEEAGATECLPCPPVIPTPIDPNAPTPEPLPAACQPGSDIGAPPPNPTIPNEPDSEPTDEPDPGPTTTATPLPLNGIWYHESSPGRLTCGEFTRDVVAMFGTVEVELIEDGARMIMRGVPDFDEIILDRIDETTYRAVIQVEDGVVTITVHVRSPILMEGEILGQYTGGCVFTRTFQLDKQS